MNLFSEITRCNLQADEWSKANKTCYHGMVRWNSATHCSNVTM